LEADYYGFGHDHLKLVEKLFSLMMLQTYTCNNESIFQT